MDVWNKRGPSNTTLTLIENGRLDDLTPATARKLDAGLDWTNGSALRLWREGVEPVALPITLEVSSSRHAHTSAGAGLEGRGQLNTQADVEPGVEARLAALEERLEGLASAFEAMRREQSEAETPSSLNAEVVVGYLVELLIREQGGDAVAARNELMHRHLDGTAGTGAFWAAALQYLEERDQAARVTERRKAPRVATRKVEREPASGRAARTLKGVEPTLTKSRREHNEATEAVPEDPTGMEPL